MKHRWLGMASGLVLGFVFSTFVIAQNAPTVQKEKPQGPYARIGFFRALDGHSARDCTLEAMRTQELSEEFRMSRTEIDQ